MDEEKGQEQVIGILGQLWDFILGAEDGQEDPRILGLLLVVILWLACLVLVLTCLLWCRWCPGSKRSLTRQTSGATTVTTDTSQETPRSSSWETWSLESTDHGFVQEKGHSGSLDWCRCVNKKPTSLV